MNARGIGRCVLAGIPLLGLALLHPPRAYAQTAGADVQKPVQQQLDELREGQQQLLKELEEIKALLHQKSGLTNSMPPPGIPVIPAANVHGEPFRGTNGARVAIIEYSDFGCSFCGRYARNVFPRIDQDYVQAGKVKYFFRDLPEASETNSWFKARVARCAGDQGKFWEMHDLLFSSQPAEGTNVVALASTLSLKMDDLNACLASEKYLENIRRSAAGAKRMGLYGTPAFLIGTLSEDGDFVRVKKALIGAQMYESIKTVLDELLSDAQSHPSQ